MLSLNIKPAESSLALKERVERYFKADGKKLVAERNNVSPNGSSKADISGPEISAFLNFITDVVPEGHVYLFGGVLRDLALYGQRGFDSDIDLVVDGDWVEVVKYIKKKNAVKNKFGGYRLYIGYMPVDIWNAKDTWAIKNGLIQYRGVASLVETTVTNWDAILMNWRTKRFVHREDYFNELRSRKLDLVLEKNPNPLGVFIRILRFFVLKDVNVLTPSVFTYIVESMKAYSIEEVQRREMESFGKTYIDEPLYKYFYEIEEHYSGGDVNVSLIDCVQNVLLNR
ncbi:MAG: hypothetical protein Tsb002_35640 [Wenzhouxiangellaceae bacterium]